MNISPITTGQAETRQALIHAASAAFPIGELEVQALGGQSAWNTRTRPGRIQARRRAIGFLTRAGELAIASGHDLSLDHVVAAIRSLALRTADVLVDSLTGDFMAAKPAIKHRGEELARTITELALVIRDMESEARP
jgi:hypothetical protein